MSSALRRSRVEVSRCFLKSSGSTSRSPVRHRGGVHSPASSRPWRAIALSIRSPSLQCAAIDSGFITIGWTRSRPLKTRLAARSSSGDACERMATSQSLVARAVPRALDPNSTTASMPGIEPTASAAVRLRRAWVVDFMTIRDPADALQSPVTSKPGFDCFHDLRNGRVAYATFQTFPDRSPEQRQSGTRCRTSSNLVTDICGAASSFIRRDLWLVRLISSIGR